MRLDWRKYSEQMEKKNRIFVWVNEEIVWKNKESQGKI